MEDPTFSSDSDNEFGAIDVRPIIEALDDGSSEADFGDDSSSNCDSDIGEDYLELVRAVNSTNYWKKFIPF